MSLVNLLITLDAAGVTTLALDPQAARVRWSGGAVSEELRAALARRKPALLALAGDEPLVVAPGALAARLIDTDPAERRAWLKRCAEAPIPPLRQLADDTAA